MKPLCITLIFVICLLVNSCAFSASTDPIPAKPQISLEDQAIAAVKKVLEDSCFCKSSDSDSYITYTSDPLVGGTWFEIRDPTYSIHFSAPLTEEDIQNKVTWKGEVQFNSTAWRSRYAPRPKDKGKTKWNDWNKFMGGYMYFPATLRDGNWEVKNDWTGYVKLDCSLNFPKDARR